jgi:hypothetical protein
MLYDMIGLYSKKEQIKEFNEIRDWFLFHVN